MVPAFVPLGNPPLLALLNIRLSSISLIIYHIFHPNTNWKEEHPQVYQDRSNGQKIVVKSVHELKFIMGAMERHKKQFSDKFV